MISYKVYLCTYEKGWILSKIIYNKEELYDYIRNLNEEDFYDIIVVRHNQDLQMDEVVPILYRDLSRTRKI